MITLQQLDEIEGAAQLLKGGPERRCHVAMANLYKFAGLLPQDLVIPEGNRDWANTEGRSLITPWVESCGYFEEVSDGIPQPGDLLGFRLGKTLHHVAIYLSGGRMIHIFGNHGLQIAVCIPAEWEKRLEKIWRIKL